MMRDVLRKRIEFAVQGLVDQLVDMVEERINQHLKQLELSFDAATSAFESDLSVTDGAARRHDVRGKTRGTRRVAQRRPRARSEAPDHEGSASGSRKAEGEERDAAAAVNRSAPAADRGVSSNPALQQGQDLPPSTSSSRACGCGPKGRHRKTCALNTSTSPASRPSDPALISPAASPSSRPSAGPLASVQARAAAQAESKPVGRLTSPGRDRFAEIQAAAEKREATKKAERVARAQRYVRKDGVRPTREPVEPDSAKADDEADQQRASIRASFQF